MSFVAVTLRGDFFCLFVLLVVKTRLQSLNKGSTEETYNGVVDCIRWDSVDQVTWLPFFLRELMHKQMCVLFPTVKSCGRRGLLPSWKVQAAVLWSLLHCLVLHRWCTLLVWENISLRTHPWASCRLEKVNGKGWLCMGSSGWRWLYTVAATTIVFTHLKKRVLSDIQKGSRIVTSDFVFSMVWHLCCT